MRFSTRAMKRHGHGTLRLVTTGLCRSQNGVLRTPMPVVHAELQPASAGGKHRASEASAWIAGSSPAMTNWTNGKERKRFGGETPTDAMKYSAVPYGHGRPHPNPPPPPSRG